MMLINGAILISPALVSQIAADTALEERLAAFASILSIMLPAGLVPTDHTFNIRGAVLVGRLRVRWGGRGDGCRDGRRLTTIVVIGHEGRRVLLRLLGWVAPGRHVVVVVVRCGAAHNNGGVRKFTDGGEGDKSSKVLACL